MIVGLCGLSGSGKDAVGEILVKAHGFIRVAFADIMKRICMEVFDFTDEQVWGDGKNEPDSRYSMCLSKTLLSALRLSARRCINCGCRGREVECCCSKECYDNFRSNGPLLPGMTEGLDGDGGEYLTPRYALQTLGSWGRDCYSDIWVEYTLRVVGKLLDGGFVYTPVGGLQSEYAFPYTGVVVTDVRFRNEIAAIKKAGGKVVRILRHGYTEPKWNHPSETEQLEVPDEEFDYILHNDGTLVDLAVKLEDMSFSLEG